jgi:hypothetical protein
MLIAYWLLVILTALADTDRERDRYRSDVYLYLAVLYIVVHAGIGEGIALYILFGEFTCWFLVRQKM